MVTYIITEKNQKATPFFRVVRTGYGGMYKNGMGFLYDSYREILSYFYTKKHRSDLYSCAKSCMMKTYYGMPWVFQKIKEERTMRKALALFMSVVMTLSLLVSSAWADPPATKDLDGKTVILHTNDVHGAIDKYEKVAALKADYEARGASVFLVDAGDYSQGSVYVSVNKGADAVTMMNVTGYDVATIGNHEFDYGYA